MIFTPDELTDIRRYCGYPEHHPETGEFIGHQFHEVYGLIDRLMSAWTGRDIRIAGGRLAHLRRIEADQKTYEYGFYMQQRWLCALFPIPHGPYFSHIHIKNSRPGN